MPRGEFIVPICDSLIRVTQSVSTAATKLDRIVDEFAGLEPRERLELLLEFAESLPPLPPRYQAEKDRGEHRVHECQTPVFLWTEVNDGVVQLYGDVAPEAPTVKGFVGILVDAFSGASAEEVLSVPPNLLHRLGLIEALGMMRMRGLQAILFAIRDQVRKLVVAE
jgi:cysteine desulfuration protein SufE